VIFYNWLDLQRTSYCHSYGYSSFLIPGWTFPCVRQGVNILPSPCLWWLDQWRAGVVIVIIVHKGMFTPLSARPGRTVVTVHKQICIPPAVPGFWVGAQVATILHLLHLSGGSLRMPIERILAQWHRQSVSSQHRRIEVSRVASLVIWLQLFFAHSCVMILTDRPSERILGCSYITWGYTTWLSHNVMLHNMSFSQRNCHITWCVTKHDTK
jgi:hypothetical protein